MPRRKKNDNRKPAEEDAAMDGDVDMCSVTSNVSSDTSADPGQGQPEVDEEGSRSLYLDEMTALIDKLGEKRAETRDKALAALIKRFSNRYLSLEDDWSHIESFLDALDKCLRKGKGEEQVLACHCLGIFGVQLDPNTVTTLLPKFIPFLRVLARDVNSHPKVRAAASHTIAILLFLSLDQDYSALKEIMDMMESIFRGSYLKGDKTTPNISQEVADLHIAALESWALLFCTIPSSSCYEFSSKVINRLPDLLESNYVDVRIVGGEVLALLFERIRTDVDSAFRGLNFPQLKEKLDTLANDGTKYRSKVDRKKQRQSFRDVLSTISLREPIFEKVRFGQEELEVCDWVMKRYYDSLCILLGSGVHNHLQENFLVRDIFDLGAPLPKILETHQSKGENKNQRRLTNQANEKFRSQARKPNRSKRADVAALADD